VHPTEPYRGKEWTQRYYVSEQYFQGPGHPIFLIFGGEGSIAPSTGLFYPFITEHLAKSFRAFVLQPEHRFYGESQPLANYSIDASGIRNGNTKSTNQSLSLLPMDQEDPRVRLFTTEQAIHDAMRLVQFIQNKTKCSHDKFSKDYCPVIAVGGSYPGFMAAFSRILCPSRIDMAYAASAPMKFYSQQVDQYAYYNHITKVAEQTKTGCAQAVRQSLQMVQNDIVRGEDFHVSQVGICPGTVPAYIASSTTLTGRFQLARELMMVLGYTFANDNMASYPPGNGTRLHQACDVFSDPHVTPAERIRSFLLARLANHSAKTKASCWNMSQQLPTGPHATISSGDWSGVGTGINGESWDFQTCTLLVEAIGFGKASMFPYREWTLEWLTLHCQERFGVTPQPYELVSRWNFTEEGLVTDEVTRILFTNGLQDGWSVGGIQTNLSDSLIAMNFPNGAHHSDLSHVGPSDKDTQDIKQGFQDIQALLSKWLDEIRPIQQEKATRKG
jgi:hypothetical protein